MASPTLEAVAHSTTATQVEERLRVIVIVTVRVTAAYPLCVVANACAHMQTDETDLGDGNNGSNVSNYSCNNNY